jgi:hypothetical protein
MGLAIGIPSVPFTATGMLTMTHAMEMANTYAHLLVTS